MPTQNENLVWSAKFFDELTPRELHGILRSRAEIFIREQGIHYVDPDDVDYESLHVFGTENNKVQAYLRAYKAGEGVIKIGRVLTLTHGTGLGTGLMKYAMDKIPRKTECTRIIMDAQKHAVPFYERLGFVVTSDEYLEAGIVHVDMSIRI